MGNARIGIGIHSFIHWLEGTSSFNYNFSYNSNISDYILPAPDNSDVFSLLHYALLDISVDYILLGDFN